MIKLSDNGIKYTECLYRKNNFNKITFWYITHFIDALGLVSQDSLIVYHGLLGTNGTSYVINGIHRNITDEINSRINAKRKEGYKYLSEIRDDVNCPVEEELHSYLDKYLPTNRTCADNSLLPMLAKVYDNTNNKVFKDGARFGQRKINGLRCFITAYRDDDLFQTPHLKFQSREGTIWTSLEDLEQYLFAFVFNDEMIDIMIDRGYILDGELYLPGHTVNDINHFVKDPTCKENKLIQYWCYDLAVEDERQETRLELLNSYFLYWKINPKTKEEHLNNTNRFNLLYTSPVYSDEDAILHRDMYILQGFEGLILRDMYAEYQFGKRNSTMIKYKKCTDGLFTIVNLIPEGLKRPDIPLFICKNDINSSEFECHINGTLEYQKECFKHKDEFIGKQLYIEYQERSGVNQLPFHLTTVLLK